MIDKEELEVPQLPRWVYSWFNQCKQTCSYSERNSAALSFCVLGQPSVAHSSQATCEMDSDERQARSLRTTKRAPTGGIIQLAGSSAD